MPTLNDLVEQLANVAHFRSLSAAERRAVVQSGQVRRYPAGATIFEEEAECAGLFVLLDGQVNLCKCGPQGQSLILATLRPVIMFNEVAALDGGPNPVSAQAAIPATAWQVGSANLQQLLGRYPSLSLGLLRVLAARNRQLIGHYEDRSFRPVVARTAKVLLLLSQQGRQPIDRHLHPNPELAARVATVPEAISRTLRRFRQQGLISATRQAILVTDPGQLASIASGDDFFQAQMT
jgi:CRP/FNR family transcriptional regulator